jgi:hypothetical protein
MNKLLQNLFLVLFPFYPFVDWIFHYVNVKPMGLFLIIFLIPFVVFYMSKPTRRFPPYLGFWIAFTIYHVISSVLSHSIPPGDNIVFWVLTDMNVLACVFFILVENMEFDEPFMDKMTRNLLILVVIATIVSLVQIKNPAFFVNPNVNIQEFIGEDIRNPSIFSWSNSNSAGICFPILIAILLNYHETKTKTFLIILLCGIIVVFLGKSRYAMMSIILAFLQLFILRGGSLKRAISLIVIFIATFYTIILIAGQFGFDIDEVITNRILEKDTEQLSAKARVVSYDVFLKKFPENPWIGVGPTTRKDVVDLLGGIAPIIHVGFLSYLYYYGVIGCFFIFAALFCLLKDAWDVGKKWGFWGSFFGLLGFCLANTTMVYFNLSEMGIIVAVIYIRYYKSLPIQNKLSAIITEKDNQ